MNTPTTSRGSSSGLTTAVGVILIVSLVPIPIILWAIATILAAKAW